jgi:hypothetical protein
VHGEAATELEEARRRSEELAREVRESAEKAKAAALAAAAAAPAPAPAPVAVAAALPASPAVDGDAFMPCAAFSGRRAGYVFRIGPQGLGYYIDTGPGNKTKAAPATATTAAAATKGDMSPTGESKETHAAPPLPLDYRQTAAVISVLVQVPGIVTDSVHVVFRAASVEVRFDAATEAGAGGEVATYAAKVTVRGGFLEVPQCRFDVTANNMVLVLSKREEGLWADTPAQPLIATEPLPTTLPVVGVATAKGERGAAAKATLVPPTKQASAPPTATAAGTDPHTLVDQLKRMQLFCAPVVFDLD